MHAQSIALSSLLWSTALTTLWHAICFTGLLVYLLTVCISPWGCKLHEVRDFHFILIVHPQSLEELLECSRCSVNACWVNDCCCCFSPTLCDPMDCSPLGCSVHGISQARILEWVAISSSRDLPNPGIELPGSLWILFSAPLVKSMFPWPLKETAGPLGILRNVSIQSQCPQYPEPWTPEFQGTHSSLPSFPLFHEASMESHGHCLSSALTRAHRCA